MPHTKAEARRAYARQYYAKNGECRGPESIVKRKRRQLEWHQENKERRNEEAKIRYIDRRDYIKDKYLKAEFGISLGEYTKRHTEQGGLCAICYEPETVRSKGKLKSLAVDHNHKTGKVRGLLCQRCNTALGSLRESPKLALALIEYLKKSEEDGKVDSSS